MEQFLVDQQENSSAYRNNIVRGFISNLVIPNQGLVVGSGDGPRLNILPSIIQYTTSENNC